MDASEQPGKEDRTGKDWSVAEVEYAITDYFDMMRPTLYRATLRTG